ncbi:DUF3597 domain-containing protein [Ramlibacter sp. PS4R-6]|uniref:DUF3597 domain-containing protein n=1 Tax=Ramlibacter sp. PS4R-6 TaxID=3133438 RepID=UPI0030A9BBB5
MSVLGNLFNRIFHRNQPGAATTTAQTAPAGSGAAPQPQAGAAAATTERVDIEKVLNEMAEKNPQKLNWRTSIVDLMKLVGMDSSLAERKQLADELGYTGDKNDSASMNIWLHKQVMKKMSENGGKVPADLLD